MTGSDPLDHAELHLALDGDHTLIPGRLPDEFDGCVVHVFDGHNAALGIGGDGGAHAAARGGEGHLDHSAVFALIGLLDMAVIDKAEVDDVDGDFGVIDVLELVPDLSFEVAGILGNVGGGALRFFFRGLGVNAEGVHILGADTGEAEVSRHGIGATEGLGDDHLHAEGQFDGVTTGDLDGVHFTFQFEGGVHGKKIKIV